jgi:hypothetical protein
MRSSLRAVKSRLLWGAWLLATFASGLRWGSRSGLRAVCWGVGLVVGLGFAGQVAAQAPLAATQGARPMGGTAATLNGMGTPNGLASVGWFEWGTNNGYGQKTSPVGLGAGHAVAPVSTGISGLVNGAVYSCRMVVSNVAGVSYGLEQRFTTGRKVSQWGGSTVFPPTGLSNAVAVAAGGSHYLAVKNDGTVVAWGSNTFGESSVPAGLSNVVAVSCGSRHSVALKADGTVVAWGVSSVIGETAVPAGLRNVVAIDTGNGHNLALVADGTVVAWGENEYGQSNVPAGLSNVVAVACGGWYSIALRNDDSLVAWGDGSNGSLNFPLI